MRAKQFIIETITEDSLPGTSIANMDFMLKQGVAEGSEKIIEYRDRMYQYLKSIVPGFPDYVVKDWLYANFARGATQGPGWSFDTIGKDIPNILKDMGLSVNTKWQLVPNMKFTMSMWEPKTLKRLQARAGGSSKSADPDVHIPARDAERHATQALLAKQQGGVRKEPVILLKTSQGYELLEGWHRTIQHFAQYPEGYTGPAWVAVAQGQQGVAEDVSQNQRQVRQTLNAWMDKDQQYTDPTKRVGFQAEVLPYIQQNIKTILADKGADGKGSYPASPYAAWLLVQHMDAYPQNQDKFLQQLERSGLDPTDGKDGVGKLQFLKDRAAVNKWIAANANNEKYYVNDKPLPNPTVNVRNPAMFKDAGIVATSREEALQNAINAGNKLLVAAVQATNAQTQPSFKQTTNENFADGRGPGRPGDSQRHGIPKGATMAELEKASHAKGRKGQLARWQLNMRRGHKK